MGSTCFIFNLAGSFDEVPPILVVKTRYFLPNHSTLCGTDDRRPWEGYNLPLLHSGARYRSHYQGSLKGTLETGLCNIRVLTGENCNYLGRWHLCLAGDFPVGREPVSSTSGMAR